LIWGLIIKQTPLGMWQCYNLDDKPVEGGPSGISAVMKKSSKMQRDEEKINSTLENGIKKKMQIAAANQRDKAETMAIN